MGPVAAHNPTRANTRTGHGGIVETYLYLFFPKAKGQLTRAPRIWPYLFLLLAGTFAGTVGHSQSGRQKPPSDPSSNNNARPRRIDEEPGQPETARARKEKADDATDIVRVSSNLVPVPTSVVDNHGVSLANLKLEDFELRVDGQVIPISDLTRSNTPVTLTMLFDNSGSLLESRDFEKRAAVRFFQNVMRPVAQAAIYSVAT